jgi:hypothetical protein
LTESITERSIATSPGILQDGQKELLREQLGDAIVTPIHLRRTMVRISENIRTSFNQDGAVLMDIQGGSMLTLNPIGSIIWQQLSDGRSPELIAEHLASEFGIARERALSDVKDFVQQLEGHHLIQQSDSESSPTKLGQRPEGLFCNLFGGRRSNTVQDRGAK